MGEGILLGPKFLFEGGSSRTVFLVGEEAVVGLHGFGKVLPGWQFLVKDGGGNESK